MPQSRKSIDERLAELHRRKQQLEARRLTLIASKKDADRKLDTRRKIIVGAAILVHAEQHPDFLSQLRDILSAAVQRDLDRQAIADLLDPPNTTVASPIPPGAEQPGP